VVKSVRGYEIKVRLNAEEKQALESRAAFAGMKPAVYLRWVISHEGDGSACGGKGRTGGGHARQMMSMSAEERTLLRDHTTMLNRWNANLNMIARWCNIHKGGAIALDVHSELVNLSRLIQAHIQHSSIRKR
jgi:hypothetical protein